ncbi:GatB/YqeY domain-containing protein [Peptoniphilus duerdenii]|uniref:YqeY-like protein n=1 Tax=Peptoniphilus duerdenii ATCC BAA-1640 TaxID=862517 RepID=E0NKU6_9FIRM|nr:GatB/YqeY domain-containing protein [Peptoniphilus duerdenii]EFM25572.1 YqeY-like protein [Peptoniphilus duerdenii ATCC BAA-1640]
MSIKEKLMQDLKAAMKSHDKIKKDTITMVRAAIKQIEVDKRVDLSDEEVIDIISKQYKERVSSIDEFKRGGRDDLVAQTEEEIKIILEYLPKQLTDEELEDIIKEAIEKLSITSKKQIGELMKEVMPKIKGKADGKKVNSIASKYLN